MIFSMILFKSGRGGIVANMTYGEAIENPDNPTEIQSPFDIDKLMGAYYSGSQKSKLKYYQQYPGVEGFPMAASRITIGLMDLKEGSHVRGGIIQRTVNDASNTVLLWIGDRYINAIAITPYLYMMYSFNMQKCFFVKRCFHTRLDDEERCKERCLCVQYHYFKAKDLFPQANSQEVKDMINAGLFCNAQCGRNKLSAAVWEVMTHQKLLTLLSVFKDPLTRIGGDQTTNQAPFLCQPTGERRIRPRTGSDVNDDRRILIEDVDEGDIDVEVDGKERDILDEDDYNEEDGDD
jgi:hypothetical protein